MLPQVTHSVSLSFSLLLSLHFQPPQSDWATMITTQSSARTAVTSNSSITSSQKGFTCAPSFHVSFAAALAWFPHSCLPLFSRAFSPSF